MRRLITSYLVALLFLMGAGLILYPTVASWKSQWEQSKVVNSYSNLVDRAEPDRSEQVELAHKYNKLLASGAIVGKYEHVPRGSGAVDLSDSPDVPRYAEQLKAGEAGIMGRVKVPSIDVDLPIYHGTSDDTLRLGAGHLEGTSLPVGGLSTRTVLTAHRGLPESTLFSNLDKVKKGDTFTLEVFGEILTYRVFSIDVVEPEDSTSVLVERDKDLATLVTCTPLGINSHRILVTGERIIPTPTTDIQDAGKTSDLPRFPWWIPISIGIIGLMLTYVIRETIVYRRERNLSTSDEA